MTQFRGTEFVLILATTITAKTWCRGKPSQGITKGREGAGQFGNACQKFFCSVMMMRHLRRPQEPINSHHTQIIYLMVHPVFILPAAVSVNFGVFPHRPRMIAVLLGGLGAEMRCRRGCDAGMLFAAPLFSGSFPAKVANYRCFTASFRQFAIYSLGKGRSFL